MNDRSPEATFRHVKLREVFVHNLPNRRWPCREGGSGQPVARISFRLLSARISYLQIAGTAQFTRQFRPAIGFRPGIRLLGRQSCRKRYRPACTGSVGKSGEIGRLTEFMYGHETLPSLAILVLSRASRPRLERLRRFLFGLAQKDFPCGLKLPTQAKRPVWARQCSIACSFHPANGGWDTIKPTRRLASGREGSCRWCSLRMP